MARDFDGLNDDLVNDGCVANIDTDIRTIMFWGIPDDTGASEVWYSSGTAVGAGNFRSVISQRNTNVWRYLYNFDVTNGFWEFGTVTTGAWTMISVDYDRTATTNDPICYEDGVLQAETDAAIPADNANTGTDTIVLMATIAQTADVDGKLAHCAFWDAALSANEHAALAHGVNPFAIRSQSQQFYYPINGNDSPESEYVQQATLTVNNATKFAGNPPVELLENYL